MVWVWGLPLKAPLYFMGENHMEEKKTKKRSKKELLRLIEATGYNKEKAHSLARSSVAVMEDFLESRLEKQANA